MRKLDPVSIAARWHRPYTSVQWAWVRALGIEPSSVWRDERRPPTRRKDEGEAREIRECFANERRVLV